MAELSQRFTLPRRHWSSPTCVLLRHIAPYYILLRSLRHRPYRLGPAGPGRGTCAVTRAAPRRARRCVLLRLIVSYCVSSHRIAS